MYNHYCLPKSQLPTDHLGINVVPLVIADCAPLAAMIHFHPSLKVFLASHQPQGGAIS